MREWIIEFQRSQSEGGHVVNAGAAGAVAQQATKKRWSPIPIPGRDNGKSSTNSDQKKRTTRLSGKDSFEAKA